MHRRGGAERCDQRHDRHDRVKEDQRDRDRDLHQAAPDEQPAGVVGVHQTADRAGEQHQRDCPAASSSPTW